MRSIKPGRGPSFMGGIMSIFFGLFGVVWTVIAAGAGGGMFALFGVFFVIFAIVNAVYNFSNATGKNRYSAYDITDHGEEPDPLNERFGGELFKNEPVKNEAAADAGECRFCPYCGAKAEADFAFCKSCGKKLP